VACPKFVRGPLVGHGPQVEKSCIKPILMVLLHASFSKITFFPIDLL